MFNENAVRAINSTKFPNDPIDTGNDYSLSNRALTSYLIPLNMLHNFPSQENCLLNLLSKFLRDNHNKLKDNPFDLHPPLVSVISP